MLTSIQLKELYSSPDYPNVSAQTRTDIIGALGIDLQGITVNEGGKFSLKELHQALRYIILTNEHRDYIEHSNEPANNNPFIFSSSDLSCWPNIIIFPDCHSHHSNSDCCGNANCGGSDGEGALLVCAAIVALACALGFCYCTGKNTQHTLQETESKPIKIFKFGSTCAIFIMAALLAWYLLPDDYTSNAYKENSPKTAQFLSGFLHFALSFFLGSIAGATISYINKNIICHSNKPSAPKAELLNELENVIKILNEGYCKPGDDKKQSITFTKKVICCYMELISTDKNYRSTAIAIPMTPININASSSSFFPTPNKPSANHETQALLYKASSV
jgi:hypothetical protein